MSCRNEITEKELSLFSLVIGSHGITDAPLVTAFVIHAFTDKLSRSGLKIAK